MESKDNWVRCPYCRHKLFKKLMSGDALIEVKCSSCKNVFEVYLGNQLTKK